MATIETDLKDILAKIDSRLDRIEGDLTQIKVDLSAAKTDIATLKDDSRELKGSQRSQTWALIGIIFTVVVSAIVKFGFFPNP